MHLMCKSIAILFATFATCTTVFGQVILTTLGTPYTEDFNTLASTGTSSTLPTGWAFSETDDNADNTYTAGTGSSTTGDTYSFGASASFERAFGGLFSGTLVPIIGTEFVNNTGEVSLSIYNANGQLVKRLLAGEMSVGHHSVVWNATDGRGRRVTSGVYLYIIKAGEFTAQRKLVLMKITHA